MTRYLLLACLLSLLTLTACGKRGDLRPPAGYEERQQTEDEKPDQ